MKYFRAFRLIGNEAIDEYYKISSELSIYQTNLFKVSIEKPNEDTSELELKINDLHQKMHEKYDMVPHLHYHAMPEKGFVSELLNEKDHKALIKSGKVKKGQARVLELQKDTGREKGYSVPVFQIDNPESIKQFNKLLDQWQKLKADIKNAESASVRESMEEQYEAFKADLKNKYHMDSEKQYVFETTEIGVYMGCSEEQLIQMAEQQKVVRAHKATEFWKKNQG
ncbi:MAG: hypothetical protein NE327_10885 [Lentisphaeraceae bacterium]|nr:hypothetical protein [Lentisphaeraceae bacterium]